MTRKLWSCKSCAKCRVEFLEGEARGETKDFLTARLTTIPLKNAKRWPADALEGAESAKRVRAKAWFGADADI